PHRASAGGGGWRRVPAARRDPRREPRRPPRARRGGQRRRRRDRPGERQSGYDHACGWKPDRGDRKGQTGGRGACRGRGRGSGPGPDRRPPRGAAQLSRRACRADTRQSRRSTHPVTTRKDPPMRWHKRLLVAGIAGVVALAASACAGGQVRGAGGTPQPSTGGESTAATTTENDATFVYAPNLDVVTDWDPATSYSNEIIALANIYEGLTRYNAQTKEVDPLLATEWTS